MNGVRRQDLEISAHLYDYDISLLCRNVEPTGRPDWRGLERIRTRQPLLLVMWCASLRLRYIGTLCKEA